MSGHGSNGAVGAVGGSMEITEVRIKLVENTTERLLAFCSITIDGAFVIRDLKLIGGPTGPFVAMPSRKLCSHCQGCGFKNPLRASYCNQCGTKLTNGHLPRDDDGRLRLYADIAHPINAACRDFIQRRIVREYEAELVRARDPGYVSRYDAIGDEEHRPRGSGTP
jgi:stage V sporulation protein G